MRTRHMIILNIVIVILGVVLLSRQSGSFIASTHVLFDVQLKPLIVAAALYLCSIAVASLSYLALGWARLRLGPTLLVQIAAGFVNRLLPAGLGGLGIFTVYLRRQKFSIADSTALVATNNLLGFVGTIIILLLLWIAGYQPHFQLPSISPMAVMIATLVAAVMIVIFVVVSKRRHYAHWRRMLTAFAKSLALLARPRPRTVLALIANVLLTIILSAILTFCASAVHGSLSVADAFMILSLGTAVGAVTPTPGGIGGIEAGLTAGLIAAGLTAEVALSAVLLYRLVTYWLPIVPGIVAFRIFETHNR